MKMITKAIEKKLEKYPLYSQDGKDGEAEILVKYFNPYGGGTWYVLEAEKKDDDYLFYGYVESPISPDYNEYGYFFLSELTQIKIPLMLEGDILLGYGKIERDLYFNGKMKDILN